MSNEYEEALIMIWQKLGRFAPADFTNPVHNQRIEAAYYAAENALYKAGKIRFRSDGALVLADQTTERKP